MVFLDQGSESRFQGAVWIEAGDVLSGGPQEGTQAVVIAGGDGVELVVVAARAGHGQAQESLRKDVHLVVDPIGLILQGIDRGMGRLMQVPETGCQHRFIETDPRMTSGVRKEIARDVFLDEQVVGHVRVEGADEVVAVAPGMGDGVVLLMAIGVSEAHQIHPVTGPSFAEPRGGQQGIHHSGPRLERGIRQKRRDLRWFRGQSDDGFMHPSQPDLRFGRRRRTQSLGLQSSEDESIDSVGEPIGSVHWRNGCSYEWLETPPLSTCLEDPGPCRGIAALADWGLGSGWKHCPGIDPTGDIPNHRLRQARALLGHLQIGFRMLDGPEKSAFLRLSGNHGCSGIAPAEQGFPGINPQSTALSLGSVAILAIGDQEGTDA